MVGVVLAAGAGRRYGGPKVAAESGDWLRTAVGALADGGCRAVMVTLGAAVVEVPPPATTVVVADWAEGLSASVRAGITAARRFPAMTGVLLLPVDIPDMVASVVRRVLDRVGGDPNALARAVFDRRRGHPVYLGGAHLDAVQQSLVGDRGAGGWLANRSDVIAVECGDLAVGRDRDTR
ncbi:NTP transferase domain-containing protein [Williamsia sp. CHRR-6]|nr:NTP transferase domain-containing protein [Williamsia sp. CHRR-6]